jgi:4-amino-4-deoxy-L-arabinose transferase-like glycosyltransferase
LEERRWWSWFIGASAAWVALVHATMWWLDRRPVPRTLWGDETTYLASAIRLLEGDPAWWPEPLWPPLYPQFVAGWLWLGRGSTTVVTLVQSALLALTAVLLFDLVRRWTGSRAAGVAAAVAALGYPPLASFAHYLWPEIVHLFLFVVLLWILAVRSDSGRWCSLAGVVLGLALLCKSLLLPIVPIFVAAAIRGRPWKRGLRAAVLIAVFALATVAPTLAANSRRLGSPSIANSATFNLWVGLNDAGRESFQNDVVWPEYQRWVASAETTAARDRILRSKIREFIRDRGFAAVLIDQLSKQPFRLFDFGCYFTDQLPGGAAQRQSGAGYLGLGPRAGAILTAVTVCSILGMYLAAALGLTLGACRGRRWVRVLLIFVAYNLALFLWLHVKTRYRIQMLPAGLVGVGCLVAWFEAGRRPKPSAVRVSAVVGVIVLLMWFALG